MMGNETLNLMCKAFVDMDGSEGKAIRKETDTHLGSTDGWGEFNWRMKFPMKVPCSFPRLSIMVFDQKTVKADESIGSLTLKFDNILKRLMHEGKYETPEPVRIKFKKNGQYDRGSVLISLKILNESDASSQLVGEGQKEPNADPKLDPPSAGRNLSAQFAGMNLGFKMFNFMFMVKVMIGAGLICSLLFVIVILFFKPGILK